MSTTATQPIAEGIDNPSLKSQLHRAERLRKIKAAALVMPLAIFLLIVFVAPISQMLWRSVDNTELSQEMPQTAALLLRWDGQQLPNQEVYATFAQELQISRQEGGLGRVGRRLNYEKPTFRGLLVRTLRRLPAQASAADYAEALANSDRAWSEIATWQAIKKAAAPTTDRYLLASLDLERNSQGEIQSITETQRVYLSVFQRTIVIAGSVTLICLLLGFPLAYLLASLPASKSNLLLIFVLLPFWTSLLVRTASWIVLLQSGGLINTSLMNLGIIEDPLQLVFNRFGVLVAMVHILLPFMILPLYSVMKGISPTYQRAAISLGCHPFVAFWKVYAPQTVSGVAAGALLVFIMALGYYITPTLVGGPSDQMVSYYVAYYTNTTNNWGMAAALGSLLLIVTLLLYLVYHRLVNQKQLVRN